MRQKSTVSGQTFVENLETKWQEIMTMVSPTPEELENFYIYALSVTTNMAQSPHKVTSITTDMLTEMTTRLSQILHSPAKTDPVGVVKSLLSSEWWKNLQNSLHPNEEETPVTFWIKGATWTPIDNTLRERRNEHDFGKKGECRHRVQVSIDPRTETRLTYDQERHPPTNTRAGGTISHDIMA
jgi:hypothetical protein